MSRQLLRYQKDTAHNSALLVVVSSLAQWNVLHLLMAVGPDAFEGCLHP